MAFIGSSSPSPSVDDPDDDPIVDTFNVFIKPELPANQRMVLTRTHHKKPSTVSSAHPLLPPTELRIKPKTGILELDIPLDLHTPAYDRSRGLRWGVAMANSPLLKAGGSHGLAGGFGIGGPPQKLGNRRGGAAAAAAALAEEENNLLNFAEAARQDKVLRYLTVGGECHAPAEGAMQAYAAVFSGNEVHLTPVFSEVNLANQFPHLAAARDAERTKQQLRDGSGPGGGGSGPGAAAEKEPAQTARAIHMTIKSSGVDGEELVTETMADRMHAIASEPFRRMKMADEGADIAWAFYDTLHLRPTGGVADKIKGKGKGKEVDRGDGEDEEDPHLEDRVPRLRTSWDEAAYIAYCDLEEKKPEAVKKEVKEVAAPAPIPAPAAAVQDEASGAADPKDASSKKSVRGRPPKGSTVSARGRGGKTKAGSSKATALNVD